MSIGMLRGTAKKEKAARCYKEEATIEAGVRFGRSQNEYLMGTRLRFRKRRKETIHQKFGAS